MTQTTTLQTVHRRVTWFFLALISCAACSYALEFGSWTESPAEAKALALQYNRPILAIIGSPICAHCDNLDKVIMTSAMQSYAKTNKLVLLHNRSDSRLRTQMTTDYKVMCGMTNFFPYFFLFKVREDTTPEKLAANALTPDQVSLLQVSSGANTGNLSGANYSGENVINGIKLESEYSWTLTTFTRVVASFFPNQAWSSLTDTAPPVDPDPIDPDPTDPDPEEPPVIDDTWTAVWTESPAEAKALALAHNRPILAIIGSPICAHCDNLDKVIMTSAMLTYAKSKKLVLLHNRSDSRLRTQMTTDYKVICGMTNFFPYFFLFKVREDITPEKLAANALTPDQVTLLKVSSGANAGNLSGANYSGENVINGIKLESEYSWTLATFCKVIESFFPNVQYHSGTTGWATLTPPIVGPTGYENAVDLGRIANAQYPATTVSGWIINSPSSFSGVSSERWYKFKGDAGKRYICVAKDFPEVTNTITVDLFASNASGAPADPPLFSSSSAGFDALERGLHMDIPDGSATNQTYFLRLTHSGGTASTVLPYTLKVHEAHINPPVGSVTNPLWRGAQKGKWTMDAVNARELAIADGAPLIYYFTGVLWCPYCVGMDHSVLSTAEFNTSISNAYLVLVDNRQRNDRGPTLLRDTRPTVGYLARNGISANDALSQIQNNLVLQNALALPDASSEGWTHGPRIGYPTLVYCRATPATRAALAGVTPIGRFSYLTDSVKAVANINELALLATQGFSEANSSPKTSTQVLPAPGVNAAGYTGGLATNDWRQFTVNEEHDGPAWIFQAKAAGAASTATVELVVYSADGTTLLRRTSGNLKTGAMLDFVPASSGQFWLAVRSTGQNSAVAYTLSYALEPLNYTIAFQTNVTTLAATDPAINLPISLTTQRANGSPIAFEYRITTIANGAPASFFTAPNTWKGAQFSAAEKQAQDKLLSVPVNVTQPADWTGSKDFLLEIRSTATGNCRIASDGEDCTVKIYTEAFWDKPVQTSHGLFVGRQEELSFRVRNYDPARHSISISPALPAGLSFVLSATEPLRGEDRTLLISGTPASAGNHTITLDVLDQNQQSLDRLQLVLSIINITGTVADRDRYAGCVCPDPSGVGAPLGALTLTKNGPGLFLSLESVFTHNPLTAQVSWRSYDPDSGQFRLSQRWQVDANTTAAIELTLDSQGKGRGVFTAPNGVELHVFFAPATSTPAEFAGIYNIALRPASGSTTHPMDGFALGWLLLTVADSGQANYSGELIDGTTVSGETTVTDQPNGSGQAAFFTPLTWDASTARYKGRLAGQLAIMPESQSYQPGAGFNDARVYDCASSVWARSADDSESIQPCGTTYRPGITLTQQAGLAGQGLDFLFETQPLANLRVVMPDLIFLTENSSGGVLVPKTDRALASELTQLVVDAATGTFNGSLNVLHGELVEQPLQRTAVALRGVLTPITSDCCSAGNDLFLGYGYFLWNDTPYVFRLSAQTAPQTPTPVLLSLDGKAPALAPKAFATATIQIRFEAPGKRIIYWRNDNDAIFLADWSTEAQSEITLTLATGAHWRVAALSNTSSPSAILDLVLPRQTVFSTTPGLDTTAVAAGWNLIGVPADQHYTLADGQLTMFFGYDASQRCYASTTALNGGSAYWLFVSAANSTITLARTEQQPASEPLQQGWSLIAVPESPLPANATVWYWNGNTYTTNPPEGNPATGIWTYLESTP